MYKHILKLSQRVCTLNDMEAAAVTNSTGVVGGVECDGEPVKNWQTLFGINNEYVNAENEHPYNAYYDKPSNVSYETPKSRPFDLLPIAPGRLFPQKPKIFRRTSLCTLTPPDKWIPEYPRYADKAERIQSFLQWPRQMEQSRTEMAGAGFFYRNDADSVTCFFCGETLRNWENTDIPMKEHKEKFPNCLFVIQNTS